jgi:hypothetical protein
VGTIAEVFQHQFSAFPGRERTLEAVDFFTSQNRLPGADLAWLKEGMAKNQNRKLAKKFLGLSPVMEICMG